MINVDYRIKGATWRKKLKTKNNNNIIMITDSRKEG